MISSRSARCDIAFEFHRRAGIVRPHDNLARAAALHEGGVRGRRRASPDMCASRRFHVGPRRRDTSCGSTPRRSTPRARSVRPGRRAVLGEHAVATASSSVGGAEGDLRAARGPPASQASATPSASARPYPAGSGPKHIEARIALARAARRPAGIGARRGSRSHRVHRRVPASTGRGRRSRPRGELRSWTWSL